MGISSPVFFNKNKTKMGAFLIFSLLFSTTTCGLVPSSWPSLVHHKPDNEPNLKFMRESKEISPGKLKRWLMSRVEVLDGIKMFFMLFIIIPFSFIIHHCTILN